MFQASSKPQKVFAQWMVSAPTPGLLRLLATHSIQGPHTRLARVARAFAQSGGKTSWVAWHDAWWKKYDKVKKVDTVFGCVWILFPGVCSYYHIYMELLQFVPCSRLLIPFDTTNAPPGWARRSVEARRVRRSFERMDGPCERSQKKEPAAGSMQNSGHSRNENVKCQEINQSVGPICSHDSQSTGIWVRMVSTWCLTHTETHHGYSKLKPIVSCLCSLSFQMLQVSVFNYSQLDIVKAC